MYILIDTELFKVLYKHPHFRTIDNLRHIECQQKCLITKLEGTDTIFGTLTDLELRMLHRNLCGQSFAGISRPHLEGTVAKMCEALPVSDVDPIEAELQALSIQEGDDEFYRYVRGGVEPAKQQALFRATALCTAQQVIPYIPPKITQPSAGFLALQAQYNAHKLQREAHTPREPRSSSPSTYEPPKGGSKTGRVWEIAEPIYQAAADKSNWKELRRLIVEACENEGINSSTASVQYGKWKQTKIQNN